MRGVQGSRAYNANGMRRGGIVLYQGILTKRKGQSHETRFCKLVSIGNLRGLLHVSRIIVIVPQHPPLHRLAQTGVQR